MKFLYLFRQIGTDNYKIGVSKNPVNRIKQLNTGNADKLELIYCLETKTPYKLELLLHNFFKNKNYENSEWFLFKDSDINLFKEKSNIFNSNLKELKENNFFCNNFK